MTLGINSMLCLQYFIEFDLIVLKIGSSVVCAEGVLGLSIQNDLNLSYCQIPIHYDQDLMAISFPWNFIITIIFLQGYASFGNNNLKFGYRIIFFTYFHKRGFCFPHTRT